MPKDKSIRKVLLIGSGGIRIGQSAEFDYSGIQALKALKEERIEAVLVNPNVATIQTSGDFADKVYMEPITPEFLERIIEREKPDGILLGFGGQTALNAGVKLAERGVLKRYGVRVLGTPVETIKKTEDREAFRKAMHSIGAGIPLSRSAESVGEAVKTAKKIGYPVILRPAYTLGGLGSGVVWDEKELKQAVVIGIRHSMIGQVLIEKYLHHWKEIEYEVVRDSKDNCITVCNMENMDPMGIHTGDSIVVAPSQTLTNKEYHKLRKTAIDVVRALGVIGECNIQFALDPKSRQYYIIEVNARLSRSSALASKATGYPLAYIAAKLAIGYSLPELTNKVTGATVADFEPSLDYIVVKVPRWEFQKFGTDNKLGPQMRSIGEVMAIGRNFEEAIQKAIRCLEIGTELTGYKEGVGKGRLERLLKEPDDKRIFQVMLAIKRGMKIERISELTGMDCFFLHKLKNIADFEESLKNVKISSLAFPEILKKAKKLGFSDEAIAGYLGISREKVRNLRIFHNVLPAVKQIDTTAAEWPARTNYLYFTYNGEHDDIDFSGSGKILILGAGPIRIGSSVEFDWCTMSCVWALKEMGYKTLVVNCNPETVSTDYDMSERLYFDEISLERVLDIIDKERPYGVIVSVGGQTGNNIAYSLSKRGVNILGTAGRYVDLAENRGKFSALLDRLKIKQPEWSSFTSLENMKRFAKNIGYPVIVRPSYVLSGSAMKVADTEEELVNYVRHAAKVSRDFPVVISRFFEDAMEVEVDGVGDGHDVLIGAVIEHLEKAGVHSGDAAMAIPPQRLSEGLIRRIEKRSRRIARALHIKGPFNIQYLVKNRDIFVIECNLRASRSMPFVSKTVGSNLIKIATHCMVGKKLREICDTKNLMDRVKSLVGVKVPMFSWSRMKGADPVLGVEMSSTGEVACLGRTYEEAFLKAMIATEQNIPFSGRVVVNNLNNQIAKKLKSLGFEVAGNQTAKGADLVIDIDGGNGKIRRKAAGAGVVVITREETAQALIESLGKGPELEPRTLEEYYKDGGLMEGKETELRISKIESGTVIDHISPGRALDILETLKIRKEFPNSIISMVTNVPSRGMGIKDILKIEGKRLSRKELEKIAELSPDATINIIKDFEVVRKGKVREMI
jgi:carbamoyl-phosphate synthase large subunit